MFGGATPKCNGDCHQHHVRDFGLHGRSLASVTISTSKSRSISQPHDVWSTFLVGDHRRDRAVITSPSNEVARDLLLAGVATAADVGRVHRVATIVVVAA